MSMRWNDYESPKIDQWEIMVERGMAMTGDVNTGGGDFTGPDDDHVIGGGWE